MPSKVVFKEIAYGSANWQAAVALREDVLRKPLGSKFTVEELKAEEGEIQVAGFKDGTLIACAVLVREEGQFKMQRVAVLASLRGQGIGARMMIICEEIAHKLGILKIYCHARNSAVDFYRQNQYVAQGDYFDEDGIPHLKMIKRLGD